MIPSKNFFTITKQDVQVPYLSGSYYYTGKAQEVSVIESALYTLFMYDDEGNEYTPAKFEFRDIGTYYIYARLNDELNYQWDDPRDPYYREAIQKIPVVIQQVDLLLTLPNQFTTVFTGSTITFTYEELIESNATLTGLLEGYSVDFSISFTPTECARYTTSAFTISDFVVYDSNNTDVTDMFNLSLAGSVTTVHADAEYSITYYEGEYDGETHSVIVTPTIDDCTVYVPTLV